MKPHPKIFTAALDLMQVDGGRVGDGGRQPDPRHRRRAPRRHARHPALAEWHQRSVDPDVTVIRSLTELIELI